MKARVFVTLKNGVLDPQGKAIQGSLENLGFNGIKAVRQGKLIEIALDEKDKNKATEKLENMCKNLLANTVIENYEYEIKE
jgi:phosphoribosylformylglycinamidine synthase